MPSLEQELERRVKLEVDAKEEAAKLDEREKRGKAFAEWEKLERLWSSPDVQWLLGELAKFVATEQKAALNVALPSERRNEHAHRRVMAEEMAKFLEIEHTRAKNIVFEEKKD